MVEIVMVAMQPVFVAGQAAAHAFDEREQRRLQPRRQGVGNQPHHAGAFPYRRQIAGFGVIRILLGVVEAGAIDRRTERGQDRVRAARRWRD